MYFKKYRIKDRLIKFTEIVTTILLISIVFLIALLVILRYIFNYSLYWVPELTDYLFMWSMFLGAILVTKEGSHFTLDFIKKKLPYNIQITLEIIFNLLIIGFLLLLLKGSINLIQINYPIKTPVLRIPMVLILSCTQISTFFILIIYIFKFIQSFVTIYNKIKISIQR